MGIREERRRETAERLADFLLERGLEAASVRALGKAAGISDRMLLYYFASREEAMTEALRTIGARFQALLEQTAPPGSRFAPARLLEALARALANPALAPYMQLWVELAACGARKQEPFAAFAGEIAATFGEWLEERIDLPRSDRRRSTASLMLATIDGGIVLRAAGLNDRADEALRGLGRILKRSPGL